MHKLSSPSAMCAPTPGDALRWARTGLHLRSAERDVDAGWLLEHCAQRTAHHLYSHGEQSLSLQEWRQYRSLVARRSIGEPLAYICGNTSFCGHSIRVDERTLIPRPETEQLVEHALGALCEDSRDTVADLGTGSGAIAITLARARPGITVLATDLDEDALAVAHRNVMAAGLGERITLRSGSWCEALGHEHELALIIANPPYMEASDPALASAPLSYEPRSALVAGERGTADLANIIANARRHLPPDGTLWLEHTATQAAWVQRTMRQHGWRDVCTLRDWENRPLFSRGAA